MITYDLHKLVKRFVETCQVEIVTQLLLRLLMLFICTEVATACNNNVFTIDLTGFY